MKPSEFQQWIRRTIKEEVAAEVSKAMGKILVEMVKEIKKPVGRVLDEEIESEPVQATVLKTNNPKLNSVLAETARNYKPLPKEETSLVQLMEGGFEKIGKHETIDIGTPKTKMDFLKQIVNESANVDANPSVLDADAPVPDHLKKILKQDFRSILALSKTKSGGYSSRVSMDG